MLLLPDGTVMAANSYTTAGGYGNAWYQLTPDIHGSYVNGNWGSLASANSSRLWFSAAVLQNGQVFVAGGEYGTGANKSEIFNPQTGLWTPVAVPSGLINTNLNSNGGNGGFSDSMCTVLPNGTVMVAPVYPAIGNTTLIYDPYANTWSQGPTYKNSQNEASWVKLRDESILTVDKSSLLSERFIPSLNQWFPDGNLPVNLYGAGSETGAGFLLPDGRAFFLGGSGQTALYSPSPLGGTNAGNWVAGPVIPGNLATPDAAAAMMANGKILCAVSPLGTAGNPFPTNTSFYEYDYSVGAIGAFNSVSGPTGPFDNLPTYKTLMLTLPDGNVLYSHFGTNLYVYQPGGSPLLAGKPAVGSVTWNGNGSLHLTGTLFNGISQGAAYGDDAQMDSNFPLVRFTDGSGNVSYGRTVFWSSTGVQTGNQVVTTECALSSAVAYGPGAYTMQVVANGIASDPVGLSGPVWVDFNFGGSPQNGTYSNPYHLLSQGTNVVAAGAEIFIKTGLSHETMTITKPMTMVAIGGPVTIGH